MKPRIRYGVLDDFGEVIRWSWSKPQAPYRYIIERVAIKPAIDWNNFEPALF